MILGSYFDVPFEFDKFEAVVSVESLHHFTAEEKILLYQKLGKALKVNDFYRYDTLLTVQHEMECLLSTGFFMLKF